jgi:trans-aconitate methyltransferase
MGDYTNMSAYYDAIMTSGYYDYQRIVDQLLQPCFPEDLLEIGCGTGLILEEIAKRNTDIPITGIDLTQSMLDIAHDRLQSYPNIALSLQNITTLQLNRQFQMAFSYGGVWYFVIDPDKEPMLVSHLYSESDNHTGLRCLADHISPQGHLLLGTQGPHFNYETTITNGMQYSQVIEPSEFGFTKHYYLKDCTQRVMAQTVQYRTYGFQDALELLASYGLHYEASDLSAKQLFTKFKKC